MLRIEHLTKKYGEKKAVDDLSLHIEKGEIYGFIGHNGAGKTTTIKSVVGILDFDEGKGIHSLKADYLQGASKYLVFFVHNPILSTERSIDNPFFFPSFHLFLFSLLRWKRIKEENLYTKLKVRTNTCTH